MDNRRGPGQGSSSSGKIRRPGQGGQPQPRPASGAMPRPASSPANPATPRPASGVRPVSQGERPSSRQIAPGRLAAPLPAQQPPARPADASEKKGGTQFLRKSNGQPPATPAGGPNGARRASGAVPASAPRSSSSRIARLTGSSSRIAAAAAQAAENSRRPETSTLGFKFKLAMLASIPIMIIAVIFLWLFGPKGGIIEDSVWNEIANDFDKLQKEIEGYQSEPQEKRPDLFGGAVERLQAILKRSEEHYQKKKGEGSEVDLRNAEEFIAKVKKTVEWMSKYREWGDMRVKVDDLFGEYKMAVSERGLDQKKSALEAVLEKYKNLESDVTRYKEELQKRYEINPWFVQEVLDTIAINLRDIDDAIVKVKKEIEKSRQGGGGGGGGDSDELKPLDRSRPDKKGPLKPEEEQLVMEAGRAVERAKGMFRDAMKERDDQKRNSFLQDARNELVPAFKTYRDLWAAYKDKGADYEFLEYDMDEVRNLDQQFTDKIKTR